MMKDSKPIPRRDFCTRLSALGVAASAAQLPVNGIAGLPGNAPKSIAGNLNVARTQSTDFKPLVGRQFRMQGPTSFWTSQLELTEVREPDRPEAHRSPSVSRSPFSITFALRSGPRLPVGIHRIHQPDLGRFDLFLLPLGTNDGNEYYEAIFS